MTTALVLSGGGNLGAAQAGMLLAMEEAGVEFDFIVGTSAGALNGAWLAGRRPATELADVWRGLRRSDIFPTSLVGGLMGFVGVRDHLASGHGLRAILSRYVNFDLLEDAPTPFRVIATDVMTGTDVCLDSGPAVDAVMASAAIPGVFAPIEIDGRTLIDGGVVNNAPISHAVALGGGPGLGTHDRLRLLLGAAATFGAGDGASGIHAGDPRAVVPGRRAIFGPDRPTCRAAVVPDLGGADRLQSGKWSD